MQSFDKKGPNRNVHCKLPDLGLGLRKTLELPNEASGHERGPDVCFLCDGLDKAGCLNELLCS